MSELDEIIRLSMEQANFLRDFHLEVLLVEKDHVRLAAPVGPEVCNNYGYAHGGFYMSLADVTAGLTAFTDGRRYVTQNASFQFLGNIRCGTAYAEGTVLHRGRTVTGVRVEITDENGKLLCEGMISMFSVQMQFSANA